MSPVMTSAAVDPPSLCFSFLQGLCRVLVTALSPGPRHEPR